MSLSEQLQRVDGGQNAALKALIEKYGGTVPSTTKIDGYADIIEGLGIYSQDELLSDETVALSKSPSSSLVTGNINYKSGFAYGNGLFVTSRTQKMYYSEDLVTWVDSGYTAEFGVKSIIFSANVFVAVGWGGDIGNIGGIIYSTDGKTWVKASYTPPTKRFGKACYLNGKFFAFDGDQNTSEYYYSIDGINWTAGTLPAEVRLRNMVYGNGTYIFSGSTTYFMSSNALSWTQKSFPDSYTVIDMAYGANSFVCVTNNTSYWLKSQNGIDWNPTYVSGGDFLSYIFFLGDRFISFSGSYPIFLYSSDGEIWTGGVIPYTASGPSVVFLEQKYYVLADSLSQDWITVIDFSESVGPAISINTPDEMFAYILQQLSTINTILSALTT